MLRIKQHVKKCILPYMANQTITHCYTTHVFSNKSKQWTVREERRRWPCTHWSFLTRQCNPFVHVGLHKLVHFVSGHCLVLGKHITEVLVPKPLLHHLLVAWLGFAGCWGRAGGRQVLLLRLLPQSGFS